MTAVTDNAGGAPRPGRRFTSFDLTVLALGLAVFAVVMVPLLYTANAAFHAETSTGLAPQWSLAALAEVYGGAQYLGFLWNALVLALVVTLVSMVGGVVMALLVARTDLPARGLIDILVLLPLFMSPLTGLIAWIILGSEGTGLLNVALRALTGTEITISNVWSYSGIVWVMFLFFCPFAYLFTLGSLRTMDSSLEEAARMAGASVMGTLWRITLPMSTPAIFAAALLIFILAAEMYTIPGMIGANIDFTTLPWRVYEDMTTSPARHAHAAASGTILLWIAVAGLLVQQRITRSAERYVTVSGKGFHGAPLRLGPWKWPALGLVLVYVFSADLLPFGALLLASFMKFTSTSFPPEIWTFKHYIDIYNVPNLRSSLINTVLLALMSAALVMGIGLIVSFAELRRPGHLTRALAFMGVLPVAVPGLVYGIGLLWTYAQSPLYGTIWVLLLAYVAKFLPYGVLISRSGIMQIHRDLELSARMSGATQLQAALLIVMPLMRATLISIFFFVMIMSMKEISASLLLSTSANRVLSVLTWSYMDSGSYQLAAAIGIVQTLIMLGLVLGTRALLGVKLENAIARAG